MTDGLLQKSSKCMATQNFRTWDLQTQLKILPGDILGFRMILRSTTNVLITRGETDGEGHVKVKAENGAMWLQARECLGVLGAARSGVEARKAVASRIQGSMASPSTRCRPSRTHSCHFKSNSVWPFVPTTPEPLGNHLSPALLNTASSTQWLRASSPGP